MGVRHPINVRTSGQKVKEISPTTTLRRPCREWYNSLQHVTHGRGGTTTSSAIPSPPDRRHARRAPPEIFLDTQRIVRVRCRVRVRVRERLRVVTPTCVRVPWHSSPPDPICGEKHVRELSR